MFRAPPHFFMFALFVIALTIQQTRAQIRPVDRETKPFYTLYKWKEIDFVFPSQKERELSLKDGTFIPKNILPLGLEIYKDRIFITLPSWKPGLPATLATVPRVGGPISPALEPYPDWSYHSSDNTNCSGLTSVFRVSRDDCGRLWVLDSGLLEVAGESKQVCPPSIIVFDLNTDKQIAKYNIPDEFILQNSLFTYIITDSRKTNCEDLHLYISDTFRFGLIVFRHMDKKFWRFTHHLFYPDPLASKYEIHGEQFEWTDGIFGLSVGPIRKDNDRFLYLHPLSSFLEIYVKTSIIRDPSKVDSVLNHIKPLGIRGFDGQVSASAIDRNGIMFFNMISKDSIGCWYTGKSYVKENIATLAKNNETLIFPNDLKIDDEPQQNVWVLSDRLPMFLNGDLNYNDYNYRILFASTKSIIKESICNPSVKKVTRIARRLREN